MACRVEAPAFYRFRGGAIQCVAAGTAVDLDLFGTPLIVDKHTQQHADQSNMEKDPDDWVTGDEPMTGAQKSYLKTLSEEAKVPFDEGLTKAEASKRIDELQEMTGRGKG